MPKGHGGGGRVKKKKKKSLLYQILVKSDLSLAADVNSVHMHACAYAHYGGGSWQLGGGERKK